MWPVAPVPVISLKEPKKTPRRRRDREAARAGAPGSGRDGTPSHHTGLNPTRLVLQQKTFCETPFVNMYMTFKKDFVGSEGSPN